ncbi:hypothetical protein BDW75DRAFT_221588 [Aspergillus navahoensis]
MLSNLHLRQSSTLYCFSGLLNSEGQRYLQITMLVSGAITLPYPIIVWVTTSTACRPLSHFWTQFSAAMKECIDINTFFLAASIINMLNVIIHPCHPLFAQSQVADDF